VIPDVAFDFLLEHGRCVGVRLPDMDGVIDALARVALVSEERAFAEHLAPLRRRTWVGGRVALRQALARSGLDSPALLTDARGAPMLPAGIVGSVSHKAQIAVALVSATAAPVGVDVELDAPSRTDIASRVLTESESGEVARLDGRMRAREVLLRFSAKEAIYKALDPFVRRYVAFQEVAVTPLPDGRARVQAFLRDGEGPFAIDVRWFRHEGLVVTTARVERVRV
jgi:4'-phosphopantetheinyl transferase EntD